MLAKGLLSMGGMALEVGQMTGKQVLKVDEWGRGKPAMLAWFAESVVLGSEAAYEACRMARERMQVGGADIAFPAAEWPKFYKDEKGFMRSVTVKMFEGSPREEELLALGDMAEGLAAGLPTKENVDSALKEMGISTWADLLKAGANVVKDFEEFRIDHVREMVEEREAVPDDAAERLGAPEMLFFFGVHFPCRMEYGVSPGMLLAHAVSGDTGALDKLLRIDKYALELEEVRARYHAAVKNRGVARRLNKALSGVPLRKLTRRKVKLSLAALIYKRFAAVDVGRRELDKWCREHRVPLRHVKVRLGYPAIQTLFDAVAQDTGRGKRDTDLPANCHSFYIGVKRELNFWPDQW